MTHTSFKQAYHTLQQHAETLRNQQEPNIDDLLTLVTESVTAYNVCKERIDAVEKAMEQALSGAVAAEVPSFAPPLGDDDEWDSPF
ncbi:MAG: exodeoxyribonuclease VII small subunit [Thiopseudomonas sp.]|nr:exodeoxyribonuclease VII small subunit [Thiopseudomonas sp.]